jgi:hypothetical protein
MTPVYAFTHEVHPFMASLLIDKHKQTGLREDPMKGVQSQAPLRGSSLNDSVSSISNKTLYSIDFQN